MRWTKRTAVFAVLGMMSMAACQQPSGDQTATREQPSTQAPAAQPGAAAPAEAPAGDSQALIAQGQQIFTGQGLCVTCHGPNGEGTQLGPSLRDSEWLWVDPAKGNLEQQIADLVKTGVPQPKQFPTPMPARGGSQISDEQVQAVAAYVASIAGAQ